MSHQKGIPKIMKLLPYEQYEMGFEGISSLLFEVNMAFWVKWKCSLFSQFLFVIYVGILKYFMRNSRSQVLHKCLSVCLDVMIALEISSSDMLRSSIILRKAKLIMLVSFHLTWAYFQEFHVIAWGKFSIIHLYK